MTWLYLSIASAITFTCLNLLSRVVSVDSKNPRALSILFNIFSIFLAVIIFFLSNGIKTALIPTDPIAYLYFAIAGLFYGLYERLRFYATKSVEASVFSIISLAPVISFFISALVNNESLTLNKILGFALIMLAIFFVSNTRKLKLNLKILLIPIIANIVLGIGWGFDKKGVQYFGTELYNLLAWSIPFVVLYFPSINIADLKSELKRYTWRIPLLSFLNAFAYFLMLKAFSMAEATKVVPINQTSTILTVICGVFLLNEKDDLIKKILAGIIAFFGVVLLV